MRKEANLTVNGLIETGELACRKASTVLRIRKSQVLVLFSALCGFAFSLNCIALPSVKIGTAPLIDPATAERAYPISFDTVHTNTLSSAPTPNEIIELARALGNSPDNIYDFVANYVDTVFMFGAQKGALGAIVDKSGTPFDQAELMLMLLRQAGYTAVYQLGTRTLTGAQFQAWTNITNAQAACNLLASGGIPGSVNGSSSPIACSSISSGAPVSSVTLEHVWVDVVISGAHYAFDPSYKTYQFTSPVNLIAAAGLTSGDPMNAAAGTGSGLATGNIAPPGSPGSPINYVANLNAASLNSHLSTYAGNLQNYIQSQSSVAGVALVSGKIKDLVGGREIHQVNVSGTRTPTLSAATVTRTWSSIPDQFRSSISITLTKENSAGTVDTTINNLVLFADDIYGRKLIYNTNFVTKGTTPFKGSLEVVDEFQRVIQAVSTYTSSDNSNFSVGTITIGVNHPYLADASGGLGTPGTYMDTSVQFPIRYSTPFTIVHGWGEANRGLIDKWASRPDQGISGFMPPVGCDTCLTGHPATKGDAKREQLAALWLVQSSKAARLHASIANSIYTHHHSIGLVAGDAEMATLNRDPNAQPPVLEWYVADNFDRVDVETGLSVTSLTSNVVDRRVAIQSIAATMDLLEGSVSAQQSDLPDTVSTATRFEWGNSPPTADDPSGSAGTGVGPRLFLDLNSTPVAAITNSLILVEGVTSSSNTGVHGAAFPTIGNLETTSRQQAMVNFLSSYLNSGFRVIASQEGFLGPGQRAGSFIANPPGAQYTHRYTHQRGGAFVAMKVDPTTGDPLEIAHVAVNVNQDGSVFYGIKGGGGGTQPDQQSNYDPAMAADILKGQFVDRSEVLGVDLKTGGVTYDSPAKLTVGDGDFPYSLSANMTWRGGIQQDQTFSEQSHVAPNTPWTTNWNNSLNISGSALEAMGETDIRATAGTIATFLAMQDVYRSPYTAQREVAAVLVGSWWSHQIAGNVASENLGTSTRQFLRKFDATWFAPGPKGFATLTQTGQRQIYTQFSCVSGAASYVLTRGWDYSSVGYVVTNANGDQQQFQFWQNGYTDSVAYCAWLHGFRMSSWTFPYGMSINFTYQPNGFMVDELAEVKNSLGRKIHFTTSGYGGFDNELTGADFRSVTITDAPAGDFPTTSTQADPAGITTTINHTLLDSRYLLSNVITADNPTVPALAYTPDRLYRVLNAYDAVSLRQPAGTRGPYQFFIGESVRADRIDPAGGNYTVVFDIYQRPIKYLDELARETDATYDGRNRVMSYTYPEGNGQVFAYDDHNNTTSLTRVGKPGSGLTFPPISAVWNQTWNKPSSITDALGCLTIFNYFTTNPGMSLLQNATRCKPDATQLNPVYAFTYNSLGQGLNSTDPTSLVVSNAYDTAANGGNLLSSTLDPSGLNAITSYGYDAIGNTTSITDPRLNVTEHQYDLDRRKTVTLHHNGGLVACLVAAEKTIYDVLGRPLEQDGATTFSTSPCTSVATWQMLKATTYTDNGKVLTEKDGASDTTFYAYDPMDRPNLVTDPLNRRVGTVYDLAGQTLCKWRGWDSTTAPNTCVGWIPSNYTGIGKILYGVYAYSPNGKQTSATDANNNLTAMTYDGVDRLSTLAFPLPAIGSLSASTTDYESYTYDVNDNRKSVRKRDGQVISYAYDMLSRRTTKTLPATTTADVWSTYDLAGRPMTDYFGSATTPSASGIVYGYDSAKRMTSEAQFGRVMSYGYDIASNRIQTSWPDTNFINYDFDALNREYQVRENGATSGAGVLAVYGYDTLSRRLNLARGNGAITSFSYDAASRLASLGHDVAGTAQDVNVTYSYTLASQLLTRSSNNSLYDWLPAAASTTYVPNGLNQYSTVAGATYRYDARGNMTADGTNSFAYDVENRLLSASGPTAVSLSYDPLGRLQSTTVGATATQYLYSGTELVAELDGSGNVLRRYVHGPGTDDPIVWYEGATLATRTHLHADERGSIVATTDASDSATIYTYGPYGEPNNWTGSRFRYTGQTAIPEARLYYYKARIYSPTLGRFLQTDPIGTKDDLNLYAYVGSDPLNGTDPTGEADEQIEEIVVQATRPPPPPPSSLATITVVGTRPMPIRIPVPAISVASATVGVAVLGVLFPSSLGSDDTCDNGNCDDDDSDTKDSDTTMDSRRTYEPNKPGRKKQGREGGNKNRGKKGFKQRNPLREPPKHTPSQKD